MIVSADFTLIYSNYSYVITDNSDNQVKSSKSRFKFLINIFLEPKIC